MGSREMGAWEGGSRSKESTKNKHDLVARAIVG